MNHRVWGWLALASLLAGCASTPLPADNLPPPLVVRTDDRTVWTTAEAEAAAAAEAARARLPGARGTLAPRRPGASLETAPAATAPAAPAAPAAPGLAAAATHAAIATAPAIAKPAADIGPPARLIYFDFDSYDINDDFSAAIEGHARLLGADRARHLVIEGHADERGGAEYNLALGQKRAHAIVKALRLLGVSDSQLEAVSFGDTRPVASGRNEEAWAQNRRAEIKDR